MVTLSDSFYTIFNKILKTNSLSFRFDRYEYLRNLPNLNKEQKNEFRNIRNNFERKIINKYNVVFTTCCGAGDARLRHAQFGLILVDEATQDPEPSCLVRIMKGSAKAIVKIKDRNRFGFINYIIYSDNFNWR